MTETQGRFFCFGFGYAALRLSALLAHQNWDIVGALTNESNKQFLSNAGLNPMTFGEMPDMSGVTHILLTVPPTPDGDPMMRMYGDLIAKAPDLKWAGYLSATSVYGDHRCGWVNETTPVKATTTRGQHRIAAEREWQAIKNLPLHIFRLSGIYGPGRSAVDTVRAGKAQRIDKPGHVFNRMHVDDIAETLLTSMQKPKAGEIYNLSDDLPASAAEVTAYAAELLGAPLPPLVPYTAAEVSAEMRDFYAECKRVHNDKIKQELGVRLAYPDYKSGLRSCL